MRIIQRTYTHGTAGVLPPEIQQALPGDFVSLAKNLTAKTVGRQLRNYGYQLAGLGHVMCGVLGDTGTTPVPEPVLSAGENGQETPAASTFKYTTLRAVFGSSANFTNNAYYLVSNTMDSHRGLQEMRDRLWELLVEPGMVSSLESFLFTGFSQRYLLARLGWDNWPWVRTFVRFARNQLDPFLPPVLQRASVPAFMAKAGNHLLEWLGIQIQLETGNEGAGGKENKEVVGIYCPVPNGFSLDGETVMKVMAVAIKHSLLPFLWSPLPLPDGLFPAESARAAETLRKHVYQRLADPREQVELFGNMALQPFLASKEDVEAAAVTVIQRLKKTEQELATKGRSSSSLKTLRRKIKYLLQEPAAVALLAETGWFPQTRLVLRLTGALTVLTGKKRLVSAVAAIAACMVVTRISSQCARGNGLTGLTLPAGLLGPSPQLTLPFHSVNYRIHPVTFPLLENKYTFRYHSCEALSSVLRHFTKNFTVTSGAALTAGGRDLKLGKAVKAGERETFARGLARTRVYLVNELPWAVTGPCIKDGVSHLKQQAAFCRYLEKEPALKITLAPWLLNKLHRGAVLKQVMLVPPHSPAGKPTSRLVLEGSPYQLYHREKTSPQVPRPAPGDLPDFPVIPADEVDLSLIEQFPRVNNSEAIDPRTLPRLFRLQLCDLLGSSCLALDVNRLGSDHALVCGGWCHGKFYPLSPAYQQAMNAQFRRWTTRIDNLDVEASHLSRKLARYRNKGHPVDTAWYRKRAKELACIHGKKRKLEKAAYLLAAETIYTVIDATRPDYFFYEDLKGLSPRGKRGSFAKLLTWMLTRISAVMRLVESWCRASGLAIRFLELDARGTSAFHSQCGGRLSRGPGQWDRAPCKRCGEEVNTHENAAFNLITRGLTRMFDLVLSGLTPGTGHLSPNQRV